VKWEPVDVVMLVLVAGVMVFFILALILGTVYG
jgi:hypothetical protein